MIRSKIHAYTGVCAFILFLVSGHYMYNAFPEIYQENEIVRYQFRANHIYMLMSSFINLALGLAAFPISKKLSDVISNVGSFLVVFATALLIAAFIIEPVQVGDSRPITFLGVVSMLVGMVLIYLPMAPGFKKIEYKI